LLGLSGLIVGAHFIVESSITIARYFGVSELIVGLTAVAIGTSLPELATSLVAALRNESDISVGNIIGSNIFNILAVIGAVCIIKPVAVDPSVAIVTIPLLLVYTFALAPILKTGLTISRFEGAVLLTSYGFYLYIIFRQ
jgi:cation:H+ antiporter